MKPTIGRIVHTGDTNGEPLAAIITKVHSDTCVSLCVFASDGCTVRTSVMLAAESATKLEPFQWAWPPRA